MIELCEVLFWGIYFQQSCMMNTGYSPHTDMPSLKGILTLEYIIHKAMILLLNMSSILKICDVHLLTSCSTQKIGAKLTKIKTSSPNYPIFGHPRKCIVEVEFLSTFFITIRLRLNEYKTTLLARKIFICAWKHHFRLFNSYYDI